MFLKLFKTKSIVNVVKLSGIIASSGSKSLNLDSVKKNIDKAFLSSSKKATAVAFIINSPGGSPVQSEIIANYVSYKSKQTNIATICFVEDVAASGGYWLAVMGNSIYALSNSSIVGSIGVVSASFGLNKFIEKYNITRRVYTAGKNKVNNDMFLEEKQENIDKLNSLLSQIHEHFKTWVLLKRGNKISIEHSKLFTGDFWLASEAIKFGLIDDIVSSVEEKLQELYGKKVIIKYIGSKKTSLISKLLGINVSQNNSTDMVKSVIEVIEEKSQYSKYGI